MVQNKPDLRRLDTNASLLVSVPKHKRITLSFKNVSAHVPVLVTPGLNSGGEDASIPETPSEKGAPHKDGSTSDAPVKERQVLFDVNGTVDPGQILALMGPSGSGKSSLLSVLGGRSTARVTGSILFNDKPMNKAMKRNMGFVTQDDLLYAELTTFETLYYAALLRLPRHWSMEDKMERVEMVIQGLGLGKCRDTIIGNQMMRGVSGGERKRVSIGHELLINPSVILLDEPTSGLDSTTALKLIHTLRSLASGGRTIIASIHQPSSRLYQEMDQLMLLSDGRTMYYGEATTSTVTWFSKQGVPVPLGVSTPDHLLDLACGDLPNRSMADSKKVQLQLLDAFEHRTVGLGEHGIQPSDLGAVEKQRDSEEHMGIHTRDLVNGAQEGTSSPEEDASGKMPLANKGHIELHVAEALQGQAISNQAEVTVPSSGSGPGAAEGNGKWGATWPEQIRILTSRCIRVRRFQALSIQRIAEVIVVAILAGLFWFQVGGKDQLTSRKIQDISGLLFFQIVLQSFSALFAALFAFPADFQMLIKERQSGMYRLTSYYFARSISDIPMDCLMPTIFVIILYWMAGLRIAAGSFFCNWLSTLLTMLVAQSLGLLISATIMNPKTSMAAATVFMLCIMLVGGYFVQSIPIWIRWLRYVSFVYYGYNLLVKIEFAGRGYSCADYYQNHPDAAPGLTWCPIDGSGAVALDVDEPVTLEVCVLIGMLIVVRVLVYVALKQKTTFKTKKVKEA